MAKVHINTLEEKAHTKNFSYARKIHLVTINNCLLVMLVVRFASLISSCYYYYIPYQTRFCQIKISFNIISSLLANFVNFFNKTLSCEVCKFQTKRVCLYCFAGLSQHSITNDFQYLSQTFSSSLCD